MFFLKFFPLQIDVIVRKIERVHDIAFFCAVKYRRGNIESQRSRRQGKMDFKHLPDIHTGRHAQRIQYDIERTAVWQIRHILYGKHTGNNTLVSVTACHFISDGNLSLLCDINADCLIYTRRQFIAVLPRKYFGIDNNSVFTVRNFQRSIAHLSCFFPEDRAEQSFFRRQLRFALRRYFTDKNIAGAHFRTDADNTSFIQIFQRIVADARNVSRNLFRSQLGIARFRFVFLYMN